MKCTKSKLKTNGQVINLVVYEQISVNFRVTVAGPKEPHRLQENNYFI